MEKGDKTSRQDILLRFAVYPRYFFKASHFMNIKCKNHLCNLSPFNRV